MTQLATDKTISQSNRLALRNPWVLGWLALVTIVLGVNIGMVTTAVVTNPGLVEKNFYEKGRNFERTVLTQRAEREALAWKVRLDLPERTLAGTQATYRFTAVDAQDRPLSGADVELEAYRPSDASRDFVVPFREVAPGQFVGDVNFPLKGNWDLKVRVKHNERNYDVSRRVSVQAP